MGLFEKDYLLRLLEQLTEMMSAIAAAIRGGKRRDALEEIVRAQALLAGPLAGSLDRLDSGSVVSLLGAEKARVHAKLLRLEAEARRSGDAPEEAKGRALDGRAAAIELALGPGATSRP